VIPVILAHTAKDDEIVERAQDKFRSVYMAWLDDIRQGLFSKDKMAGWYKNFEFGMDACAAVAVCLAQASDSISGCHY
jgi:hypothetical protein